MDQRDIYERRAHDYHRLVSREDCDGNLLPAINSIMPLAGARVVEVGAGTGRLTAIMAGAGAQVRAVEPADDMRHRGVDSLTALGLPAGSWSLIKGEGGALPFDANSADLAIAGWVFGHLRGWRPDDWRLAIGRCLDDMARVVRPGGSVVIIETLGTGVETPAPPSAALAEYYQWMEDERGFERRAIRTDYAFESLEEALELCGFFFGEEKARRVREQGTARVPECTGVWARRLL